MRLLVTAAAAESKGTVRYERALKSLLSDASVGWQHHTAPLSAVGIPRGWDQRATVTTGSESLTFLPLTFSDLKVCRTILWSAGSQHTVTPLLLGSWYLCVPRLRSLFIHFLLFCGLLPTSLHPSFERLVSLPPSLCTFHFTLHGNLCRLQISLVKDTEAPVEKYSHLQVSKRKKDCKEIHRPPPCGSLVDYQRTPGLSLRALGLGQ